MLVASLTGREHNPMFAEMMRTLVPEEYEALSLIRDEQHEQQLQPLAAFGLSPLVPATCARPLFASGNHPMRHEKVHELDLHNDVSQYLPILAVSFLLSSRLLACHLYGDR